MNDDEKVPARQVLIGYLPGGIMLLAMLASILGGLGCFGLMVHGAYALFAISVSRGLMEIGGAVVLGLLTRIGSVLLIVFAEWLGKPK